MPGPQLADQIPPWREKRREDLGEAQNETFVVRGFRLPGIVKGHKSNCLPEKQSPKGMAGNRPNSKTGTHTPSKGCFVPATSHPAKSRCPRNHAVPRGKEKWLSTMGITGLNNARQ